MRCNPVLLSIRKLTQHRRTRNLNASVYILSINWYVRSDCEMRHPIVTAEGVGARYRCNVQQHLLILIYPYGTRFINWRKNEGGSKILNWGRGTLRFRVLLCCVNELEYFWTFNSRIFSDMTVITSQTKLSTLRPSNLRLFLWYHGTKNVTQAPKTHRTVHFCRVTSQRWLH